MQVADAPLITQDASASGDVVTSPIEPFGTLNATFARIKSPGQYMHFTAGLPFRILADGISSGEWVCPPGHPPYNCPDEHMDFFVDSMAGRVAPDERERRNH